MALFDNDVSRWAAVESRNPRSDGVFVYCVKTTQIYCRPVCKARLARRSNVSFQGSAQDAENAGFRPCKRCKPELAHHDPHADVVEQACSTIKERLELGEEASLRELATEAGMTESHFHRVFKSVLGITPKSYTKSVRDQASTSTTSTESSSAILTPVETDKPIDTGTDGGRDEFWKGEFPNSHDSWAVLEDCNTENVDQVSDAYHQVDFTIQPWSNFYVMIAIAENKICAIDTADSYVELITAINYKFPASALQLVDWTKGRTAKGYSHELFESVMDALQNPCGRTLNVSPQAFTHAAEPSSHLSFAVARLGA